ncbi:Mu-like prophage major head subunit gpT family protein [Salipiger sp. 1_MG-2023]|uniref:prohead protease/major capsid protein fusion protein n=1 Tax=Salipiger sp. 1_MG-2023 TaxID=3062665 RepID=UPI0026E30F45|nr:prohead protease/major capsid protein fusion protein [Salipiger sp. 1_MG-2023]MDO6587707.1 Mu-like prophage major head subunit gpT family protein [Salipiger sp. 1_MG-2023]
MPQTDQTTTQAPAAPPPRTAPRQLVQGARLQTLDEAARTVEVVFSTGDLVHHWVNHNDVVQRMPTRILLEEGAGDLAHLIEQGSVLDSHMEWGSRSVIGSIEDAWIEQGAAKARLRFSSVEEVEPIWQRVVEGTLRNVSVGFEPVEQEVRIEQGADGERTEVMYFTQWRPFEISVVPRGADRGARMQSAQPQELSPPGATTAPIEETTEAAPAANHQQEANMPTPITGAVTQAQPPVDQAAIRQQAAQDERARIAEIRQAATQLGTTDTLVQSAIDDGTTIDAFRAQAIEAFAQAGQSATAGVGGPRASVTQDATERFRQGAAEGLMARAGMEGGQRNEFTGMTLAELARQSLTVAGVRAPSDRRDMVGQAFVQSGAHSTSDFANVLANVAHKAALRGWNEAEETFQMWTRTGTLTDFKATKRVGLGLAESLPEVAEGGEYTYGTIGDRGEMITLATYGKMLKITRQAIINDDLALFSTLPGKMGRAAKRTIGNLAYAILTGNPTMSDGTALFHADHNNLAASGAVPSITTMAAGKTAMRTQKESATGPALNITPKYMIVPAALEVAAAQLLQSAVDPTANKGHASNPVAGMAQLIVDGRLDAASATGWYLAADPNAYDTIEVAYLDGVQEPYLEEKTAWSTDGVELKVRIDAGVAPLDHRTLYKNAGS